MEWLWAAARPAEEVVANRCVVQGPLLASGGFAYVYRGSDKGTGEQVAIRRELLQDRDALKQARGEIALLERLPPHPHVVRFLGAQIKSGPAVSAGWASNGAPVPPGCSQAVSLFELCPGGTLLARLESACAAAASARGPGPPPASGCCCPCLPEAESLGVLGDTAAALAHLHAVGIIHYDVKSENLLLGADRCWKLGDFGSASERTLDLAGASRKAVFEAEEFIHGRCTPIYRAPELADVHLRWPIGPKVDVFALGCVHFAVLTGRHPFEDSALANIQARFRLPPEADVAYSPALLRWVGWLLAREPEDRPSASEVEAEVRRFQHSGEEAAPVATPGPAEDEEWVADFSLAPPWPPAAEPPAGSAQPDSAAPWAPVAATSARPGIAGAACEAAVQDAPAAPEEVGNDTALPALPPAVLEVELEPVPQAAEGAPVPPAEVRGDAAVLPLSQVAAVAVPPARETAVPEVAAAMAAPGVELEATAAPVDAVRTPLGRDAAAPPPPLRMAPEAAPGATAAPAAAVRSLPGCDVAAAPAPPLRTAPEAAEARKGAAKASPEAAARRRSRHGKDSRPRRSRLPCLCGRIHTHD